MARGRAPGRRDLRAGPRRPRSGDRLGDRGAAAPAGLGLRTRRARRFYAEGTDWALDLARRREAGATPPRSWTPPSGVTRARPPTTRAACRARSTAPSTPEGSGALVLFSPPSSEARVMTILVGLDRHRHRAVAGPVLGVDGVVLDGRVEPEAVALLAVVERALELLPPAPSAAATATAAPPAGLLLVGLVLVLVRCPRPRSSSACISASSAAATSASSSARRSCSTSAPDTGASPSPSPAASAGDSSCSRLKARMSPTDTSSWWAIQASVRPWRTQVRIWFSCSRRSPCQRRRRLPIACGRETPVCADARPLLKWDQSTWQGRHQACWF